MALDFDDLDMAESALRYDNATEAELELSTSGSANAGDIALIVRGGLSGDELCSMSVNPCTTVRALKACIAHRAQIPASEQRLLARGVQICDHEVLGDILAADQDAPAEVALLRASAARAKVLDDMKYGSIRLQDLDEEVGSDAEVVIAALANDASALQHASPAALQHRGVIMQAVQLDGANLQYAAEELRKQPDIALAAVQQTGAALAHVPIELRFNREVLIAAVKKDGLALQYAPQELKGDFELVLAAVRQNGAALAYARPEAWRNNELVLAAVESTGGAILRHADRDIRTNADIIKAAVQRQGLALEYAVSELQRDRSIVLAAVQSNGLALAHADSRLQDDLEVVTEAVRKQGISLQWASDRLRQDKEVVLAALNQDIEAIRFAAPDAMLSTALMEVARKMGVFENNVLDVFLKVSPEVANRLHQKGQALIFDARFLDSFSTSHVRGAYSLPLDQRLIAQSVLSIADMHPERIIILYSDNGLDHSRDAFIARMLRRDVRLHDPKLRPVLRMAGGLNLWKEKRLPVEGDPSVMVWSEREELWNNLAKARMARGAAAK